jgi:hypothetical protein
MMLQEAFGETIFACCIQRQASGNGRKVVAPLRQAFGSIRKVITPLRQAFGNVRKATETLRQVFEISAIYFVTFSFLIYSIVV